MWSSRMFYAGLLTNAAMGVLYLWSLFQASLETALDSPRSVLSLAPAVALVCFTVGMAVHDQVLRRLSLIGLTILAFACAGGGHLLSGLWPGVVSLLVGYGVLFGFGAGLGYGLALALATRQPPHAQALAVGLTVAAFALGGVVLAAVLPETTPADVSRAFILIGFGFVATGIVVAGLLMGQGSARQATAEATPLVSPIAVLSPTFLKLGFAFFIICYLGLMVVSHAAGLLTEAGVPAASLYLGPILLNVGYVFGSLLGGRVVEAASGRWSLAAANLLAAFGLIALLTAPSLWIALAGTALVGLVFGGSASLMPILIGERYGVERIGAVYGKLMIAYGLAGLVAPWLTATLFVAAHGYASALYTGLVLAGLGVVVAVSLGKDPAGKSPVVKPATPRHAHEL